MVPFHLSTSLLNSEIPTTMWAANQEGAPAIHDLPDLLSPSDWTAFMPLLVIVLALAAANKPAAMQLIVSTFRLGRRALVYLAERAGGMIVDRLLELLVVALIAIMASVSWLSDIAAVLGRMFH
jgi:hypothetical protein